MPLRMSVRVGVNYKGRPGFHRINEAKLSAAPLLPSFLRRSVHPVRNSVPCACRMFGATFLWVAKGRLPSPDRIQASFAIEKAVRTDDPAARRAGIDNSTATPAGTQSDRHQVACKACRPEYNGQGNSSTNAYHRNEAPYDRAALSDTNVADHHRSLAKSSIPAVRGQIRA